MQVLIMGQSWMINKETVFEKVLKKHIPGIGWSGIKHISIAFRSSEMCSLG